jgi:hypothetical protein
VSLFEQAFVIVPGPFKISWNSIMNYARAVPWLSLVAGLSPRRPVFDPGSVHVGIVVDKVALGQVFLRVLRFSPVSFITPVLHYNGKAEKTSSSSQGCTISLQGCCASVASAAGLFSKKKKELCHVFRCYYGFVAASLK